MVVDDLEVGRIEGIPIRMGESLEKEWIVEGRKGKKVGMVVTGKREKR